jgi:hypothetical protein
VVHVSSFMASSAIHSVVCSSLDTLTYFYRESPVENEKAQSRHSKQRGKTKNPGTLMPLIPSCSCGAARVFEMQLLPTLLHVLEVDKSDPCTVHSDQGLSAAYEQGGMNWGNVAIYGCPNACSADQEYVLVQESVDERPTKPRQHMMQGDVLIQDNAKFDDDDEYDENEDNCDEEEEKDGIQC